MLKKGSRKQNKSKTHRKPLLLTPWVTTPKLGHCSLPILYSCSVA